MNASRNILLRGRRAALFLGAGLLLAGLGDAAAQSTNRAAGRVDYSSFRGISERNIFNASRSGGRVATTREARRPARVDTVTLVGTLQSGNGWVAFFDGSGADYRKALNAQGRIAGYTLTQVAFNRVQLEAKDKKLALRVGHSLRRENGGEWKVSPGSSGVASAGGSSTSSGRYDRSRETPRQGDREASEAAPSDAESPADVASDAVDEVLRRLMEQREREDR